MWGTYAQPLNSQNTPLSKLVLGPVSAHSSCTCSPASVLPSVEQQHAETPPLQLGQLGDFCGLAQINQLIPKEHLRTHLLSLVLNTLKTTWPT